MEVWKAHSAWHRQGVEHTADPRSVSSGTSHISTAEVTHISTPLLLCSLPFKGGIRWRCAVRV